MSVINSVKFIDHQVTVSKTRVYLDVVVDVAAVLKSWQLSVFSFEWLDADGAVKPIEALKEQDQQRRKDVEAVIEAGGEIEKPVLGIGIQDNVEIGSGKAAFLVLAAQGANAIPVHIPQSNEKDFKAFIVKD
jgi:hypothetical protein